MTAWRVCEPALFNTLPRGKLTPTALAVGRRDGPRRPPRRNRVLPATRLLRSVELSFDACPRCPETVTRGADNVRRTFFAVQLPHSSADGSPHVPTPCALFPVLLCFMFAIPIFSPCSCLAMLCIPTLLYILLVLFLVTVVLVRTSKELQNRLQTRSINALFFILGHTGSQLARNELQCALGRKRATGGGVRPSCQARGGT